MHFGLSETQKLLQESVLRFGEKQIPSSALRETNTFCALQKDFDALGLSGLLIPEASGGAGGSLLDLAIVQTALGQFAAPIKFMSHAALLPLALKEGGSPQQQEKLFPQLLANELAVAIALEEGGVEVKHNQLSGEKTLAFDGGKASLALLACDDSLYLLPLGEKARIEPLNTIDATRQFGKLVLNDAPAERLEMPASRLIAAARIMLAADMIGLADSMLAQALAYAKTREQFNRVIASFQAVKHQCAEMAASLEPCRAMLWLAAHSFDDEPQTAELNALLAKIHIGKVARFVARQAVEVFGGFGFTDEANLHFWFKRIGANYQMLGQLETLTAQAARLQFNKT